MALFPNMPRRSPRNALKERHFPFWHGSCSVSSTGFAKEFKRMSAQENQVALPLRSHTILGVCEGLGEDFGFNPIFLRIPLAASVIWNPMIAIGTYFALGAIVLVSRVLFPKAKAETSAAEQPATAANEQSELAKAA
jgi:phage shock protein PspC (stress-responsive transcriptional regulator)